LGLVVKLEIERGGGGGRALEDPPAQPGKPARLKRIGMVSGGRTRGGFIGFTPRPGRLETSARGSLKG